MNLMFEELDTPTPVTYPVRVILNNRTVSVFSGNNFDTIYRSFELSSLKMTKSKSDPVKCFVLHDFRDSGKKVTLCILPEMLKSD